MTGEASRTASVNQNQGDSLGCTDYRKFMYAKLIFMDDSLAENGLSWQLLIVMIWVVVMQTCSFLSIFASPDAKNSLDNVRSTMLGSVVTVSLFNQYFSRKILARVHAYLEKAMRTLRTGLPEERLILTRAKNKASAQLNMYVKIFACNFVTMVFSQPLGELMRGKSWKKLPVPWAFPANDSDTAFWLVFSFQFTAAVISHCVALVIMSFTSITIQMNALFDVLLLSLSNIESRSATRSQRDGTNLQTARIDCLQDDVSSYIELIREMASITPYFRNKFLIISGAVPLVMACEAYPLMLGNLQMGDLIKSFTFLAIQFLCWAEVCSRFEGLTDKHFAVFYAVYDTPWFEAGKSFQKLVLTTLTYATQPKYIKALLSNEVSANMATFYSFVVSAFNLLNMIRNI